MKDIKMLKERNNTRLEQSNSITLRSLSNSLNNSSDKNKIFEKLEKEKMAI